MRWLAFLLFPSFAMAQPVIETVDPQEYGWWIGDELVQQHHISLPDGVTIDPSSLPRPRAVDYWLDLRDVATTSAGNTLTLTLRWQNFYAAIAPDRRKVPASLIRFSDGSEATLPGFVFVSSPLRPVTAPSSPDQMQAEARYHLIDPTYNRVGLFAASIAFLTVLAMMARHQAWWPFHKRADRPFTFAARHIARSQDAAQQRRHLHRAFDRAFGRVLIGSDLPRFLDARPEFRVLEDRLNVFFGASDAAFFGTGPVPVTDIAPLALDLSRIERVRS